MAAEAGDASPIHDALHEVVALHPVLVGGAFREVHETGIAEFVILELTVVGKFPALVETNRPVVVLPEDRIRQRLSLGMTLDACVVGAREIQPCRVDDGRRAGLTDVLTPWAVTLFAP